MYWNKETRIDGRYYRRGDWSVKRTPADPSQYTDVAPPVEAYEGMPVDWNEEENKWDYDLESYNAKKELAELDDAGELNRTVEEVVDMLSQIKEALDLSATFDEFKSKVTLDISEYGKAKSE